MTPTFPPSPAQGETAGVSELKPCPCCGCLASTHAEGFCFSDGHPGWRIECEGACHLMTCYWHTEAQAIEAWNRRAALAPTSQPSRGKCGGTRVIGNGGSMNYGEFVTQPCPGCPDCAQPERGKCERCGGDGIKRFGVYKVYDEMRGEPEPCPDCAQGGSPADPERPESDAEFEARDNADLAKYRDKPCIALCSREALYEFLAAYWPEELAILKRPSPPPPYGRPGRSF